MGSSDTDTTRRKFFHSIVIKLIVMLTPALSILINDCMTQSISLQDLSLELSAVLKILLWFYFTLRGFFFITIKVWHLLIKLGKGWLLSNCLSEKELACYSPTFSHKFIELMQLHSIYFFVVTVSCYKIDTLLLAHNSKMAATLLASLSQCRIIFLTLRLSDKETAYTSTHFLPSFLFI